MSSLARIAYAGSLRCMDDEALRWGVWLDSSEDEAARALADAGMAVTSASPGMGAPIDALRLEPPEHEPYPTDLKTVGDVNDLAYGNRDSRLERTLSPLPNGILHAYRVDLDGRPAAVAMALHHDGDCGVSFVATVPEARRRGLATNVMRQGPAQGRGGGLTGTTP